MTHKIRSVREGSVFTQATMTDAWISWGITAKAGCNRRESPFYPMVGVGKTSGGVYRGPAGVGTATDPTTDCDRAKTTRATRSNTVALEASKVRPSGARPRRPVPLRPPRMTRLHRGLATQQ